MFKIINLFDMIWVTIEITKGFYNFDLVTKDYGFSFMNGTLFVQKDMHVTFWSKTILSSNK
jgi:hypothetical protein